MAGCLNTDESLIGTNQLTMANSPAPAAWLMALQCVGSWPSRFGEVITASLMNLFPDEMTQHFVGDGDNILLHG